MAKEMRGEAGSIMSRKDNKDDGYFTFLRESKIIGVFIFTFANKVK